MLDTEKESVFDTLLTAIAAAAACIAVGALSSAISVFVTAGKNELAFSPLPNSPPFLSSRPRLLLL